MPRPGPEGIRHNRRAEARSDQRVMSGRYPDLVYRAAANRLPWFRRAAQLLGNPSSNHGANGYPLPHRQRS